MKLHVLSDLHHELEFPPPELPEPGFDVPDVGGDVLVLAGDINKAARGVRWAATAADRLRAHALYVPGNHEFYGQEYAKALREMREAAAGTSVHFLHNDTVVIDGVRFLGTTLWTDLSACPHAHPGGVPAKTLLERALNDYRTIRLQVPSGRRRRLRAEDTLHWNRTAVAFLARELARPFAGPTVVLTHHGPAAACQHPDYPVDWVSNGFWSHLEHLLDPDRLDLWVFGHTHASLDTEVNGVRLVSNPKGYPAEAVPGGFDPAKLFEVNAP